MMHKKDRQRPLVCDFKQLASMKTTCLHRASLFFVSFLRMNTITRNEFVCPFEKVGNCCAFWMFGFDAEFKVIVRII
jgi:hypothetical protein